MMVEKQATRAAGKEGAEHALRTYFSPLGMWGRRWVRVITYIIIAGALVMVTVPIAMKHYLQSWLVNNGADQAVVRDIDLNPFLGSLRLKELDVKIGDRTVMGNVDIHVDVGLTALIHRTITVESATLDAIQLEIERLDDGRLRIGSLVLGEPVAIKSATFETLEEKDEATAKTVQPGAAPAATAEAALEEEGKPWSINLRQLRMTNSEIRYLSPELNTTLAVTLASVDRVYTGFSSERGDIKLEGSLGGTPIELDLVFNINPGITLEGTAKVDGLKLQPLMGLMKEQVTELGGVVNLDGEVAYTDGPEQPMSAKYDGSVSLAEIAFGNKDVSISGQTIGWDGAVAFEAGEAGQVISLDGTLESGGLELQMPVQQVNLKQSAIKISGKTDVKFDDSLEAKYNGEITLSGIDFGTSELKATNEEITWNGDVVFSSASNEKQDIKVDGRLKGSDLKVDLPARQMSVVQSELSVEGRTDVRIGDAMRASYTGAIALNGSQLDSPELVVDGTSLTWNGAVVFVGNGDAGQAIDLDGKLSLNDLSAKLPKQAIDVTQGEMGVEARGIKLTLLPDDFDVSGNAALNASNTEVKKSETGALLLSLAALVIEDAELQSSKQITVPSVEFSGLKAGNPQSPDMRIELDSLALESLSVANFTDVDVAHVRTTQLQVVDEAKDIILTRLSELGVSDVKASGAQKVSVGTISLSDIAVLAKVSDPESPPMGKIGTTEVSMVTYTPEGVTVDTVKINGVEANIVREQSGKNSAQNQLAESAAAPAEAAADDKKDTKTQDAQPADGPEKGKGFKFSIGELELTGDSLVYIEDRTVTPPFRMPLRISKLILTSRNREQALGPMDITVRGGLDEYAVVKVDGMADPGAQAVDIKLDIDDVNMIVLTPYTVRTMGYQVDSGHLSLDSTIRIADGRVDAQNKLFLRELYMDQGSEEIAAEAAAEIGMPIEKAMDMLRDKQGNIKLDVPMTGELTDFRVDLGDAIGTALRSGLKSTTIAYLKFVNPTYGVGVTVLEKVKEQVQKIRIGPIEYEAGKSEPPKGAAKFVAEAAAKLKKDEKLDVRVCPYATGKDLAAIGAKPAGEELGKELLDKMFLLGHARAAGIKRELISKHDVDPGRVIVCVTEYDKSENAKPRVKFVF